MGKEDNIEAQGGVGVGGLPCSTSTDTNNGKSAINTDHYGRERDQQLQFFYGKNRWVQSPLFHGNRNYMVRMGVVQ